ncbi:NAD(P)-binding protein [Aspergillus crustosus]
MSALLKGKVSIITGASSGLGRAIASAYRQHGAIVVYADRNAPDESIHSSKDTSLFVKTDVSNTESVQNLVQTTVKEFGRIDIMVNNAGIAPEASSPRPINEITEETFDSTWAVNVRGVFLGCKYAGAQMLQQPKLTGSYNAGSIINLASVLGQTGLSGTAAYAASKGAVIALTRTVAMDFAAAGVHCNAILPGFTRTPMISSMTGDSNIEKALSACHPLQRLGEPEEIADAAVFLASRYARGITGVNLPVDGGLLSQLRLK